MEKLVRVKTVYPVESFQGQNGDTITKVPVELTDGIDTFVAEAFDKVAIQINTQPLNSNCIYHAQCQMSVADIKTNDGRAFKKNIIRLNKIIAV